MYYDLPPQPPARYMASEYCASTSKVGLDIYRVDVDCYGSSVEFHSADGTLVATLAWTDWKLNYV